MHSHRSDVKTYLKLNHQNINSAKIVINPSALFIDNDITWQENNEELIYQGNLYDVISMKNEDGKVILFVLPDAEEEEIKSNFASNYNTKSNNAKNKFLDLLKQFLTFKFISDNNSVNELLFFLSYKHSIFYLIKPSSPYLTQEINPPESISFI